MPFAKSLPCDNRGSPKSSNFMWGIWGIFANIWACDDKDSSNFQVISLKLSFLREIFSSWKLGPLKLASYINKNALFLRKFQLLIIEAVQIFELHQQNCFIFTKI